MEIIVCPQCGTETNLQSAKFCEKCGYRLDGGNDSENNHVNVSQEQVNMVYPDEQKNPNQDMNNRNITYQEIPIEQQRIRYMKKKLTKLKGLRIGIYVISLIFLIYASVYMEKAFSKKNDYYNSDSEYSFGHKKSINAYVNGDAYNYIINGNYFTGYAVIGCSCLICHVILVCTVIYMSIKANELSENYMNFLNQQENGWGNG